MSRTQFTQPLDRVMKGRRELEPSFRCRLFSDRQASVSVSVRPRLLRPTDGRTDGRAPTSASAAPAAVLTVSFSGVTQPTMNLQLGKRIEEKEGGKEQKRVEGRGGRHICNFAKKQSLKPILEFCDLSILLRFCRQANTNLSS